MNVSSDESLKRFKDEDTYCICPRSSDPFYIASLLYKRGLYFPDIQYCRMKGMNGRQNEEIKGYKDKRMNR